MVSKGRNSRFSTNAERREKRNKLKKDRLSVDDAAALSKTSQVNGAFGDEKLVELLEKNEDDLINLMANINKVYTENLKKDAPFMTFMLCGMQSAGKSTIMERFLNAVLNIVQEGTGTRCPLDTTCIHDESRSEPICELHGEELLPDEEGDSFKVSDVFEIITEHNRRLAREDRFSTKALRLVYRANNVQNMRFVDTPGIITTQSKGKDNRDEIKGILRNEMKKPNTKLCLLLEPKEYATNTIINFCDETFGTENDWKKNAIFLMTKFDKQLEDSRTGTKANSFFKEFETNGCLPHLVITPTLPQENLATDELFDARSDLLKTADEEEKSRFDRWLDGQILYRQQNPSDVPLNNEIRTRVGFFTAKSKMRSIMLEDTMKRLPEVLSELRAELSDLQKEERILSEKMKFNNPGELKLVVQDILYEVERRITSYLDGDLESSLKFPEKLKTLWDEIDDEEDSDWAEKELNHHTEAENRWRELIADAMENDGLDTVQAEKKFLGGKQVQRAIFFFQSVMIEALPNIHELGDLVPNAAGYLGGKLGRENWERAMVQIVQVSLKKVSHPGINYLIKHFGSIFRGLFSVALEDVKQGEKLSSTFSLLPSAVEKHFLSEFDDMLWNLMCLAADKTHCSLEPMYSTIDPELPTFHPSRLGSSNDDEPLFRLENNQYVRAKSKNEEREEGMMKSIKNTISAMLSSSGEKAKDYLRLESKSQAATKKFLLPDERSSMITNDETQIILQRSFEYMIALMKFNLVNLKFQLKHYLVIGFKDELSKSFKNKMTNQADWATLVEPDKHLAKRVAENANKIKGVRESLQDVERLHRNL